ncbi:phosphopantetheine-binding protein [Hydrococcus rivularis NIES-593]|uniref:Phosphopantetheine-binding protein n=2 Tax=Hydrococcus TaxID=1616833 RepID=A0A1U7HRG5_9CYAN|nr:acyl carrier protein [Hydrococcus rivularis]OKH26186.1 phosphopantetheine-binding protein [Hydrococcus rivularis NIES-593]
MQIQNSSFKLDEQAPAMTPAEAVQNWLVKQLSEQLSLDPKTISVTEPLTRYGLDSIDAVTMVGDLEDWLDLELPSTLFWDHPTIEKSAQYLCENFDLSSALGDVKTAQAEAPSQETVQPASSGKKGWGGLWGRK